MSVDSLRHLKKSLKNQRENLDKAGRILRSLRYSVAVTQRRLDEYAEEVSEKARRAAEPAPDQWPRGRVEFGEAVRKARESAGLTRRDLAKMAGVAGNTVASVERSQAAYHADTRRVIVECFEKLAKGDSDGR